MKNIKNLIATGLMVAVLMVGTSFAKGGLLMSDFAGNQNSCSPTDRENGGIIINDGIIVAGFTGIIVAGFTGIIVAGLNSGSETTRNQTSCRDGLLMSD